MRATGPEEITYSCRTGSRRRASRIAVHRVDGRGSLGASVRVHGGMKGALGNSTLEMTRNIPEGDRVAVDIEGTTIGGIAGAYLFFKEAREVGGGYWGQIRSKVGMAMGMGMGMGRYADRRRRWRHPTGERDRSQSEWRRPFQGEVNKQIPTWGWDGSARVT